MQILNYHFYLISIKHLMIKVFMAKEVKFIKDFTLLLLFITRLMIILIVLTNLLPDIIQKPFFMLIIFMFIKIMDLFI